MKTVFNLIKYWIINICVGFLNVFIWRNKRIWLFGSWMGNRFADNSRFLYQYLFENKKRYKIKQVIWVTRDHEVYKKLRDCNYDVLMMHSFKSFYYHLKAGTHVVCNAIQEFNSKTDIMCRLSFGAKKIQLSHGIGIKACWKMCREKTTTLTKILDRIAVYSYPGMWGKCHLLSPSEEDARVEVTDLGYLPKKIIYCLPPRLCDCLRLTADENSVLERITRLKANNKIILFLPTFKDSKDNYVEPTSIEGFYDFLKLNNLIWIRKNHFFDKFDFPEQENDRVMTLDNTFDVNILYDYIDLLITDYSSAASDAIFKNKPTLEYCPDYDYYRDNDRGFVADFMDYHVFEPVKEPSNLFAAIKDRINIDISLVEKQERVKRFLFSDYRADYNDIVESIIHKVYRRW